MTSSPAQIAASLNAQGIQHLDNGDYKQAYAAFSNGLSVVKQAIACLEDHDDEAMDTEVAASICSFHQSQAPKLFSKKYTEDQVADDSFVFPHPMAIADTAAIQLQQEQEVSYTHYIEQSFMQLYNLALCHHLSALSDRSAASFEKKLQKALSLYELAYTITLTEDNMQPTVTATMAIVNNLGNIHKMLNHADSSRQCFQNLLSTIMFVKDCGEQVEQMDGFLSNVMNLMNNTCITMAAAA